MTKSGVKQRLVKISRDYESIECLIFSYPNFSLSIFTWNRTKEWIYLSKTLNIVAPDTPLEQLRHLVSVAVDCDEPRSLPSKVDAPFVSGSCIPWDVSHAYVRVGFSLFYLNRMTCLENVRKTTKTLQISLLPLNPPGQESFVPTTFEKTEHCYIEIVATSL